MNWLGWPALVGLVLLSACAARPTTAVRVAQPVTGPSDGVMVVFVRKFSYEPFTGSASDSIVGCVEAELRANRPSQRLVPYEDFRRAAFPDVEPQSAPRDPEYLQMLLDDPRFRDRVKPLGIRFLVFVGGVTKNAVQTAGGIGGGFGAGGFLLVYVQWDKATHLGATVLDVTDRDSARTLDASAYGSPWLLIVEIVPIGAAADTEAQSCHQLGKRLAADLAKRQSFASP